MPYRLMTNDDEYDSKGLRDAAKWRQRSRFRLRLGLHGVWDLACGSTCGSSCGSTCGSIVDWL